MSCLVCEPCENLPDNQARILWRTFDQRVEPFVRIIFRWEKKDICARSTSMELQPLRGKTEKALVAAIYYASANSLTAEDCWALLGLDRSTLLDELQSQCERGLLSTNIFCMSDVNIIKAIILYIVRPQRKSLNTITDMADCKY
jgi:hypothetical protein